MRDGDARQGVSIDCDVLTAFVGGRMPPARPGQKGAIPQCQWCLAPYIATGKGVDSKRHRELTLRDEADAVDLQSAAARLNGGCQAALFQIFGGDDDQGSFASGCGRR